MANADETREKESPMIKVASFIVDKRMLFFLIYIILIIFSVFARNWVGVENSLSYYLPESTETKQGLDVMDREFETFGTARVMVANISYEDALDLEGDIKDMDGVSGVTFTSDSDDAENFAKHYNNGSALYDITFRYDEDDDRALEALSDVENALSSYDIYVSTSMGNQQGDIISEEINRIMVLVAAVVLTVLLFTTQSTGEIPVLCITFVVSLIVNSGTNFLYGTISFVSNSVCAILQLGLSIDYAIMYCNMFKAEKADGYNTRDAAVISLSKSIPEILASSLTTIGGLFAMMFMQYGIGSDLGKVLIKSILVSLITVFTLMPGLLMLFSNRMERTQHKNLVPKITGIGKFDYRTRHVIPFAFFALFIAAAILAQMCPYVYGYSTLSTPVQNDVQIATNMINDNFGEQNYCAVVIPNGDYKREARLIRDLESRDEVDYCTGLANTEAMGGYTLTDTLTPRQFSELMGVDYEVCEVLYSAYAADQEEYGRIVGGVSSYKVVLMDMLQFLNTMVDEGYVSLDADTQKTLTDACTRIEDGRKQLEGDDYDRILVYLTIPLPEEDDSAFAFVDTMHNIAQSYYEGGNVYVVGNATSERDLRDTYETDNIVVSIVSILFVLVVLLFTFKSAGLPVLLIFVIEGAIFCNFAYPKIANEKLFFMSYLIVSSIQMGANIDYAIAISTEYTNMRANNAHSRKESIISALNFAFPTILTSGSIMIFAGLFIGMMTSDACICSIGQCLARGTTISVVLVLFVLPQLLVTGDKIIEKTTFDISRPIHTREERGRVVVNGMIRGMVNGRVVGTMNAIVIGEVRAVVVSGSVEQAKGDEDIVDTVEGESAVKDVSRMIEDRGGAQEEEPRDKDPGSGKEKKKHKEGGESKKSPKGNGDEEDADDREDESSGREGSEASLENASYAVSGDADDDAGKAEEDDERDDGALRPHAEDDGSASYSDDISSSYDDDTDDDDYRYNIYDEEDVPDERDTYEAYPRVKKKNKKEKKKDKKKKKHKKDKD